MALTKESRSAFIKSSIKFMLKYKLDGIDLDREFPGLIGYGNTHRPEDKENFTYLLKELREELDKEGKKNDTHYLSTIAAAARDEYIEHTEMGEVQKYLDFINIMAYDLYEAECDSITGHHAPLYQNPNDPKKISAKKGMESFVKEGVPPEKLVLGVPFYGRAWANVENINNGLYSSGGELKERLGTSFKSIETKHLNKNGFVRYWDSIACVPYLWNDSLKIFVSYEDEQSLYEKCKFINKNNYKGAMFWEYSCDHKLKLIKTLHKNLRENAPNNSNNNK